MEWLACDEWTQVKEINLGDRESPKLVYVAIELKLEEGSSFVALL